MVALHRLLCRSGGMKVDRCCGGTGLGANCHNTADKFALKLTFYPAPDFIWHTLRVDGIPFSPAVSFSTGKWTALLYWAVPC